MTSKAKGLWYCWKFRVFCFVDDKVNLSIRDQTRIAKPKQQHEKSLDLRENKNLKQKKRKKFL